MYISDPSEVHPRIRGEDLLLLFLLKCYEGSPPHTRGRSISGQFSANQAGFTPAYAGKMRIYVLSEFLRKVHPRIRGEDGGMSLLSGGAGGSPPHTRGRFGLGLVFVYVVGFTPAYAGKIR